MKYQAIVYIHKAVSGYDMRYGIYDTFSEASAAVKHIKSVNTIDSVYIEEKYVPRTDKDKGVSYE